jgi:hypothetical protein
LLKLAAKYKPDSGKGRGALTLTSRRILANAKALQLSNRRVRKPALFIVGTVERKIVNCWGNSIDSKPY